MILFPHKFRLNSDDIFLAVGHIFIKDFLQRFTYGLFCRDSAYWKRALTLSSLLQNILRLRNPKKHPFSETVNYNAWCELALSKKQEPVLVKPIFPFQKL